MYLGSLYDQPLAIITTSQHVREVRAMRNAYDVSTLKSNSTHCTNLKSCDNVNHLVKHEITKEEHLDSDVESDIDDNTIPYHQYQLDSEVQDVPTEVSSAPPGLNSWIPAFAHVINQRTDPCRYPSGSREFKPVKAMFTEQIIPFYENVKQLVQKLDENIVTKVTEYMRIFDELDTEYERCVLANKNLKIERKNLLIQNDCLIDNYLEKDICSIVLASDIVVPLVRIGFAKNLDLIAIGNTPKS
ncbi:hypothetical protein Tco_0509225 [Tanacetum coccineum]